MSARQDVAAALAEAVPAARVLPYAKGLDNMPTGQPVLMVYRTAVAPSPHQGVRADSLAIWCAIPNADPEKADDLLDDLLDQVLAVLDGKPFPSLAWTEAERDVLFDTYPGYVVTCSILTPKE